MPGVEVDGPERQRDVADGSGRGAARRAGSRAPAAAPGPVSPATKQSGARSPSRTCWSMWTKKKSCSPSSSTGELSATTTSPIPSQKRNWRAAGDRQPAPRERPGAAQVEQRRDERRRQLQGLEVPGRGGRGGSIDHKCSCRSPATARMSAVHLSTTTSSRAQIRDLEARYVGKLGFRPDRPLRPHRRDTTSRSSRAPRGSELDRDRVQAPPVGAPARRGQRRPPAGPLADPRLDHSASRSTRTISQALIERAASWHLPVQERGRRRTFVTTNTGYRVEVHPPRDWIDDLLGESDELSCRAAAAHRPSGEPGGRPRRASSAADLDRDPVEIGDTIVRFVPGGPEGRPELHGERFARCPGRRPPTRRTRRAGRRLFS